MGLIKIGALPLPADLERGSGSGKVGVRAAKTTFQAYVLRAFATNLLLVGPGRAILE
jgi:hypothetical protein